MSSFLFVDIESSGLGENAAILEIAAVPYIDGEYLPHFQSYLAPHLGATLDPKAFEINGIDIKSLNDFPSPSLVVKSFVDWIDSHEKVFTLIGHNVQFDKKKLYELFCRTAHYSSFVTRFRVKHICTMKMAKELFKYKKIKPEGFSLSKLCKFFNISLINAHSALPDIQATIKLYEELKAMKVKDISTTTSMSYAEKRRKYMSIDYCTVNPEGDFYIHCKATRDSAAMQFILSEIYDLTVDDS